MERTMSSFTVIGYCLELMCDDGVFVGEVDTKYVAERLDRMLSNGVDYSDAFEVERYYTSICYMLDVDKTIKEKIAKGYTVTPGSCEEMLAQLDASDGENSVFVSAKEGEVPELDEEITHAFDNWYGHFYINE